MSRRDCIASPGLASIPEAVGRPRLTDSARSSNVGCPMELTVNGQPREVPRGTTVRGLLALLGIPDGAVAVERNGALVRRRDHDAAGLEPGDRLEIVTFVGGG